MSRCVIVGNARINNYALIKKYIKEDDFFVYCEKDDTDTCYAMKEGIERGFDEFLFVGVIGERFDHTFGNISLLLKLDEINLQGKIIDDYSEMLIVPRRGVAVKGNISYFSLLVLSDIARGVTITGAKYNLDDAEISNSYQYGISNELVDGQEAKVYCREGKMLLVKVFS